MTGELHSALGSEPEDAAFAPEEPSAESMALLVADIDEQIERVFLELPDEGPTAEIAGRGQDVRERLQALSATGTGGRVIRTHGDLHLGQTMLTDRGWVILDFEGEPARPLPERRLKRSPLRDVAGMLRSFSYAAAGSRILRGVEPPEGWEAAARAAYLEGYRERVDRALLPPGQDAIDRLLAVFELEKAVYELRYELNNRPDWVGIPVAGIARLLDAEAYARSGRGLPLGVRELDARADAELRVDAREVVLDRLLREEEARRHLLVGLARRRRARRCRARAR